MIFGFRPKNLKTPRRRLMAFIMSWRENGDGDGAPDASGRLARFRHELYLSLGMRRDVLFEACDAALCKPGRVLMLAELSLEPECRRGHGAVYDALNHGEVRIARLRRALTALPLDAVRLRCGGDLAAVTAAQVRDVVTRLIAAGHWKDGDPAVMVIFDAGYEPARLAWLLRDLPVQVTGRLGTNRVLRLPPPARQPGQTGRPVRHGPEVRLAADAARPEPDAETSTVTSRYGTAARARDPPRRTCAGRRSCGVSTWSKRSGS
jgi:DDE superfamily endonuclease